MVGGSIYDMYQQSNSLIKFRVAFTLLTAIPLQFQFKGEHWAAVHRDPQLHQGEHEARSHHRHGLFRTRWLFTAYPWVYVSSNIKYWIKQDKVNYAVSDREDRVTGATMLTRMAGCNRMYWAATVLCWAVLGVTGMYWAVLGCTELFWAVWGCTAL